MEAVYQDYAPRGVQFYFVYKSLAHPEKNGYVQPFTLEERLMHVKEAKRTLGSKIPWICDSMDNRLKHALGNAPNSEFVIGPKGRIVRSRAWSDPTQLRKDLEMLVGQVAKVTRVSDLNLKRASTPTVAAQGVVERLPRPRSMKPLQIQPLLTTSKQPFYVKLRAESDQQLQQTGQGKLYLGFHLDPLYHVHWNNLTKPVRVELKAPAGVILSETSLEGPTLKEPADVDPREFLIDVEAKKRTAPIEVTVKYFACNDEEGWCKAVTQQYKVTLEVDSDAGSAMRGRRGDDGGRRGRAARPRSRNLGRRETRDAGRAENMFTGRIARIDRKQGIVTLRVRGGDSKELRVTARTRVFRNRDRSDFADLRTGDRCQVQFEPAGEGLPMVLRMRARNTLRQEN